MKSIMKKNSLKLTQLNNTELSKKEMREIKGGGVCGCGCCYAGTKGRSSIEDNRDANNAKGLYSPDCDNAWSPQKLKKSDKLLAD